MGNGHAHLAIYPHHGTIFPPKRLFYPSGNSQLTRIHIHPRRCKSSTTGSALVEFACVCVHLVMVAIVREARDSRYDTKEGRCIGSDSSGGSVEDSDHLSFQPLGWAGGWEWQVTTRDSLEPSASRLFCLRLSHDYPPFSIALFVYMDLSMYQWVSSKYLRLAILLQSKERKSPEKKIESREDFNSMLEILRLYHHPPITPPSLAQTSSKLANAPS